MPFQGQEKLLELSYGESKRWHQLESLKLRGSSIKAILTFYSVQQLRKGNHLRMIQAGISCSSSDITEQISLLLEHFVIIFLMLRRYNKTTPVDHWIVRSTSGWVVHHHKMSRALLRLKLSSLMRCSEVHLSNTERLKETSRSFFWATLRFDRPNEDKLFKVIQHVMNLIYER